MNFKYENNMKTKKLCYCMYCQLAHYRNEVQSMCKYCDTTKGTTILDSSLYDGEGIEVNLDAELGNLIVDAQFDSGCLCDFMTMHINYCPMCGRKLAD